MATTTEDILLLSVFTLVGFYLCHLLRRNVPSHTGRYKGLLVENSIQVEGLSGIVTYGSVEGSIGAGKSTFMALFSEYIKENRLDATDPSHIVGNERKDYFLLVDEPVDEWTKEVHRVGDETISSLEMFYRNRAQLAFPFQCYTFTTRLRRLKEALRRIVPTTFPRRIHIVSERSLRGDKIFLKANIETSDYSEGQTFELYVYNEFHDIVCEEVMKKHNLIIHIPTQPLECKDRIKSRDRVAECNIPDAYLNALENGHKDMLLHFDGKVFDMQELASPMPERERKKIVYKMIQEYCEIISTK